MKNVLTRILPSRIRSTMRALPTSRREKQPTIAEGWEEYAQRFASAEGRHLGNEWNRPDCMGIDVPADQAVQYLDERVFAPFFGSCEVMLEIGAGGGRFTEVLLPKCKKLIAADTSPTMTELLKNRFAHNKKIEYLLLDGRGLSQIPDESVDAAFSYGVFVHLQHWDVYNYLTELKRVLKPGGRAIVHHANTFSELGWAEFLQDVPPSLNRHKLPGTFALMTPGIMTELAERAGLKLVDCITDMVRRDCITLATSPDE